MKYSINATMIPASLIQDWLNDSVSNNWAEFIARRLNSAIRHGLMVPAQQMEDADRQNYCNICGNTLDGYVPEVVNRPHSRMSSKDLEALTSLINAMDGSHLAAQEIQKNLKSLRPDIEIIKEPGIECENCKNAVIYEDNSEDMRPPGCFCQKNHDVTEVDIMHWVPTMLPCPDFESGEADYV